MILFIYWSLPLLFIKILIIQQQKNAVTVTVTVKVKVTVTVTVTVTVKVTVTVTVTVTDVLLELKTLWMLYIHSHTTVCVCGVRARRTHAKLCVCSPMSILLKRTVCNDVRARRTHPKHYSLLRRAHGPRNSIFGTPFGRPIRCPSVRMYDKVSHSVSCHGRGLNLSTCLARAESTYLL